MSPKKKYILALSALGIVAVALIVAIVSVLAAFNATATNGIQVSYTAKNINATVTAGYATSTATTVPTSGYTTITSGGATSITFSSADADETVTKSFDDIGEVTLTQDDYLYIKYTIQNTGTTSNSEAYILVTVTTSFTTNENLTIEYSNGGTSWSTSLGNQYVALGTTADIYIRITVTTKTESATLDGSFNFNLEQTATNS